MVGREGITRVLQPDLNEPEIDAFRASAATVRKAIIAARMGLVL